MGLFAKFKEAWLKPMSFDSLNEGFYDDLEEALILADVGMDTAVDAVAQLKKRAYAKLLTHEEDVKNALRDILAEKLTVGDPALAVGTDIRIAGGELLCTSLSGVVQVLAADGHGRNASLCTLHVDQLQELLALAAGSSGSRCCKSGYDAQHNNAEHHFQNIVLTHIQDSSLTMLQKRAL